MGQFGAQMGAQIGKLVDQMSVSSYPRALLGQLKILMDFCCQLMPLFAKLGAMEHHQLRFPIINPTDHLIAQYGQPGSFGTS